MLSDLKRLGKHSAIYGLSNALCSAIGFFLIPLYTKRLTPAEYGVWELFFVAIIFLPLVLELGLGSALFKAVLFDSKEKEHALINTAFLFIAGFSSLVLCLLYLNAASISAVLIGMPDDAHLFKLVLLVVFFNVLAIIPMSALRMREQSLKYGLMNLIKFITGLALNIYFIAVLGKGVEGIVFANVIQSALFIACLLLVCRNCLGFSFSKSALAEMLKFGMPLVLISISFVILNMSDRYFLRFYAGIEELGLYSIGYKIGMAMNMVVGSIQVAWPTIMYKTAKKKNGPDFFARSLTYVTLILMAIWLVISLFTREIFVLFTSPAYYAAQGIVPVILLSYLLVGIYYLTAIGANVKHKTHYLAFAATTACGVNLLLNYLLIPRFGMYGAAAATVFSFFIMTAISYRASIRLFPVPYEWGRIGKSVVLAFGLYFVGRFVSAENTALAIIFKSALVLLFPTLLYFFNILVKKEKLVLQNLLMTKPRIY